MLLPTVLIVIKEHPHKPADAVHCVVFGGFSPDSLASRIEDSQAKLVPQTQAYVVVSCYHLKKMSMRHLRSQGRKRRNVIVVYRNANPIDMKEGRTCGITLKSWKSMQTVHLSR